MRYAHIVGWGKYAPERVMTNDELATLVDTTDTWIRERTGIGQRHLAGPKDTCASIATAAAIEALDVANITAAQIGLIIVGTSTPDFAFPSTACLVQDALGADTAGAFDLSAACSGFVYGLSMAADAIKAGSIDYALVIGSDIMSRLLDWKDRNTCVLFGDGDGAVVLQASDQPGGLLTSLLRADGSGGDMLYVRNNYRDKAVVSTPHLSTALTPPAATGDGKVSDAGYIFMNGREVFRFGSRILAGATREIAARAGWELGDIDLIIPHQANNRIIESAAKSLALPLEKMFINIEHYANTSAATIPIAICDAVNNGRLRPNDKVVLVGFGAGLTWAAAALQWGTPRVLSRTNRTLNRVRLGLANVRSRARRVFRRLEDSLSSNVDHPVKSPVSPASGPDRSGTAVVETEREGKV